MGCCDAPGLMPIEEAMDKMLSRIKPIQTTLSLPLAEALGFVLAEDILSPIHVPPFDNSAMDGYAFKILSHLLFCLWQVNHLQDNLLKVNGLKVPVFAS
jgi:hypothetical protein